jgi:hypothetical protein
VAAVVECTPAAVAAECTPGVECMSAAECALEAVGSAVLKQAWALGELAQWTAETSLRAVVVVGLRRADIEATPEARVMAGE